MGTKLLYKFEQITNIDNPNQNDSYIELLNRSFTLLEKPAKSHCLWVTFQGTNIIWRSKTSIQNIDIDKDDNFTIKTRSEIFHIQKFK